jgi:hypothetical protein
LRQGRETPIYWPPPGWADAAGDEQGPAWRRALAVSTCHPAWGAEMLETCGSSPKLIDLVRRHQDRPSKPTGETDRLLLRLRQADNQS